MSPQPRDSQRGKIFTVEQALTNQLHPRNTDLTIFTNKLVNSAWLIRRMHGAFHYVPAVDIRAVRSAGSCHFFDLRYGAHRYRLDLSPHRYNQLGVLHAIAHLMATQECRHLGVANEAAHGRTFARCYLELVKHEWGNDAAKQLRVLYQDNRVKRIAVSEETREKRRASWEQRQIVEAKSLWGDFIKEKEES